MFDKTFCNNYMHEVKVCIKSLVFNGNQSHILKLQQTECVLNRLFQANEMERFFTLNSLYFLNLYMKTQQNATMNVARPSFSCAYLQRQLKMWGREVYFRFKDFQIHPLSGMHLSDVHKSLH